VDSALLRELGERLVGKPHIALAELVKNSYDADASVVEIVFRPDGIEVRDNGNGMTYAEFEHFWMRIGSPHKQTQRQSRRFQRPLTGSKGVGRLAVQFLARQIELRTIAAGDASQELDASVDWNEAVEAGELTAAEAWYQQKSPTETFPDGSPHGTVLLLSTLNQTWTVDDVVGLAQEIWWLQPPFRTNPKLASERARTFVVKLQSADAEKTQRFEAQMQAYLRIWHARLVGELVTRDLSDKQHPIGLVRLSLEFAGGRAVKTEYSVPNCFVRYASYEIRTFYLAGRQSFGIKVNEAREYFNRVGGVHIYDAGFHLPYYGPDTDWLKIEIDHSHRLSRSKLLPDDLQIPEGLNFLPTNSRLFGVVHVDTSLERDTAGREGLDIPGQHLEILVTRDRLAPNKAFDSLQRIVRWALDLYAMEEAKRALEEAEAQRPAMPSSERIETVSQLLERYRPDIPARVFESLSLHLNQALEATESDADLQMLQIRALAPLATAGMGALAYEHEVAKQYSLLESLADELRAAEGASAGDLQEFAHRLTEWIGHARATRALFSHLLSADDIEERRRLKVVAVVETVKTQVATLMRGVKIDSSRIDAALWFPSGTFAEWSALLQNVFFNAANALVDRRVKMIGVSTVKSGQRRRLLIQDTGSGVDLTSAERLFKPFIRAAPISPARRALGLGGAGLGLAIVKLIAESVGCRVAFVEPVSPFRTAFELSWREHEQ
jgi:signal transduction histidine kinase